MECGIEYKGVMFVFDDDNSAIVAIQGETRKYSCSSFFTTGELVLKFMNWRGDLYALVDDGKILKLENLVSGSLDNWIEEFDTAESLSDFVNFQDTLYIIGRTNIYRWNGSSVTVMMALPANHEYYCAISVEDSIFLYGDDSVYTVVDKYDGTTTIVNVWQDTTHGLVFSWFLYTVYGKPHLVEYKGKLYFTYYYDDTYTHLIELDLSTMKYRDVSEIGTIEGVNTALLVDNGMILISVFSMLGWGTSNVYVYVLEDYVQEEVIQSGTGQKDGRLFRVGSDPIMPSQHDKERLVYYPIYSVIGNLTGSISPVFKYSRRMEFYTDLNEAQELVNLNVKDVIDNICNILDSYLVIRPDNIAEVDKKAMVGRSNLWGTLSDDVDYGDIHITGMKEYIQGFNNFRRITINWSNPIWGGNGVELVGVPSTISVSEFSYDSFLVNNPVMAKNIAIYLFNNMFSSDLIKFDTSYAPFITIGKNLNIKAIGSYLYIDVNKEFKIVELQHSWVNKKTEITLLERNLIFESLEI